MTERSQRSLPGKEVLHPRNPHRQPYDFARLAEGSPAFARFVITNRFGGRSVDFADPEAVKALNAALLKEFYGVDRWDLPPGCLCPPIPGRADYIHHVADLLASDHGGTISRGPAVSVLDVGVGASCVYPIVGSHAYGWRFVGSEVDPAALASARRTVEANPRLKGLVQLRLQPDRSALFATVVQPGERFDLSVCNPPFHASPAEARKGTLRKLRNLGGPAAKPSLTKNFGGTDTELWCEGGELGFIRRMIQESAARPEACRWFTTLVSQSANLPALERALAAVKPRTVRTLHLAQGQKRSRILAWTFGAEERRAPGSTRAARS